jgi:hypothetical protein
VKAARRTGGPPEGGGRLGYPDAPVDPVEPPIFGQFGFVAGVFVAAGVVVLAASALALVEAAVDALPAA